MSEQVLEQNRKAETTCRCCMAKGLPMRPLFGSSLDEMLKSVSQLEVDEHDGLPDGLCYQCVLQISRGYRFREQCRASDAKLRDMLTSVKAEEPVPTPAPPAEDGYTQSDLVAGIIKEIEMTSTINVNETDNDFFEWIGDQNDICGDADLRLFDDPCDTDLIKPLPPDPPAPKHLQKRTPQPVSCETCGKKFESLKKLNRHVKIHDANKPFQCSECEMKFSDRSNYNKHCKLHTGEQVAKEDKIHLCSICGRGFKWASSLYKHMRFHTHKNIFECQHCDKFFVEKRSLETHIRSHTGERPFVCEHCNKGFTQLSNLEKHTRSHRGLRPFKCDSCEKAFTQRAYLTIHMRSHTGEKPFKCKECDKSFAGSSYLSAHQRTHTGERPYPCNFPECEKSFARLETVIVHRRLHTGEKPFICSICPSAFTNSSQLNIHTLTHDMTSVYTCTICSKEYSRQQSLNNHMKNHKIKANDESIPTEDEENEVMEVLLKPIDICDVQKTINVFDANTIELESAHEAYNNLI